MANQSMTALVSAFARAYHAAEDGEHVFVDSLARTILGETDYDRIAAEWSAGAKIFAPDFEGDSEQALHCVVNRILAGAPLARAAFAEGELRYAVAQGAEQLSVQPDFDRQADSFCSLLGLSYYLTEPEFTSLLTNLRKLLSKSRIAFDFPLSTGGTDDISALAAAAGERMRAQYTPESMERLLRDCGWRVRERLSPENIEQRYFSAYNAVHSQTPIQLAQRISLCCAETE